MNPEYDDDSRVLAMRDAITADKERVHDLMRESNADGDDPMDMLVHLQVMLADAYPCLSNLSMPAPLFPLYRAAKLAHEQRESEITKEAREKYRRLLAAAPLPSDGE